jgi:MYXO-CTERM domain-containing protein
MNRYGMGGLIAALMVSVAPARASVYSAAGNTLPGAPFERFDAGHFFSTFPLSPYFGQGYTPAPDHSVAGGIYSSGQTDQAKYTFWFDASQTLNSTTGVDIIARLKVTSSTSTTDRAGVAIGMTDSTNNYTEVYLGTGEIFINGTGRVRSAAFTMNTTDDFHDYLVHVQGTSVSVFVDGVQRLAGNSFFASVGTAPTLPNWAALGDITSSAAGAYQVQSFAITVPEPAALGVLGVVGLALARQRRRV